MSEGTGSVRNVAWTELFPWLMLFRVFRLSTSIPILFVATIGACLVPVGWTGADSLFLTAADRDSSLQPALRANRSWPAQRPVYGDAAESDFHAPTSVGSFLAPMLEVFSSNVDPFRQLLRKDLNGRQLAYFATGAIWNLFVWAFFGGVITRIGIMRFGREQREGIVAAMAFVGRRFISYFAAPLFPLVGVALVVLLSYPIGLCLQSEMGVLFASLFWVFVLIGGVILTVLLLGLLFGWPLMWGTLSTETMGDVFEAAHRAYSFTFSKPLNYIFYALLALAIGSVGFLFVHLFAESILYLSDWAVSRGWGAGSVVGLESPGTGAAEIGTILIHGLNDCVITVASAFRFGFFWCAVAAVYLLVRRDTDHTEFDDVYVPDEQPLAELPEISTDADGLPEVRVD